MWPQHIYLSILNQHANTHAGSEFTGRLSVVLTQIHIFQGNHAGFVTQFMVEVKRQEDRHAHIGNGNRVPINFTVQNQIGVLPQNHQHTQHQGQNRANRKPLGTVTNCFKSRPCAT